jgi:hypothetical protein
MIHWVSAIFEFYLFPLQLEPLCHHMPQVLNKRTFLSYIMLLTDYKVMTQHLGIDIIQKTRDKSKIIIMIKSPANYWHYLDDVQLHLWCGTLLARWSVEYHCSRSQLSRGKKIPERSTSCWAKNARWVENATHRSSYHFRVEAGCHIIA